MVIHGKEDQTSKRIIAKTKKGKKGLKEG